MKALSDGKTVRAKIRTDSAVSDGDPFDVSFMDVGKLVKSLTLVAAGENVDSIDIEYKEPFLVYENIARFSLKTVKYDSVERYVTADFGDIGEVSCAFETTTDDIGKTIQQLTIFSGQEFFVYLKDRSGQVVCDLDNHNKKFGDSVGVPIGSMWRGSPDNLIGIKVESFKLMNMFPGGKLVVGVTRKNVVVVDLDCPIEIKCDGPFPSVYNIKMRMLCPTLKT